MSANWLRLTKIANGNPLACVMLATVMAQPVAPQKTQTFVVSAIVTLGLIGALGCGSGSGRQTANTTDDTYEKAASDAVDQYNIARQNGTPIDQCVQARVVAAAYLRAKDEDSYKIWKETEATDCGAVGMRPQ